MVIPLLKDSKITCLSERYVLAHQKIRALRNSVGFITWRKPDRTLRKALAAWPSSETERHQCPIYLWLCLVVSHLVPPTSRCWIAWGNSFTLQLQGYFPCLQGLLFPKPGLHGCLENGNHEDLNECILLTPICTLKKKTKQSNIYFSRAFSHFTAPVPVPASAQGSSRLPPIKLT